MSYIEKIFLIIGQAYGVFFYTWFISLPLACLFLVALYKLRNKQIQFPRYLLLWGIVAIAIPLIMATVGAYFYNLKSKIGTNIILALLVIYITLFVYEVFTVKGFRLLVISFGGLMLLLLLGMYFIAGMAIQADWI